MSRTTGLSKTQRELLDLWHQDTDREDICDQLGITENTLRARTHRLQRRLGTAVPYFELPRVAQDQGLWSPPDVECETCNGTGDWTGISGDDEHTQEGGCYACGGTGRVKHPLVSHSDGEE